MVTVVIGVCSIYLEIPAARSLKDKRRVLRSVVDRVRHEFNVSIAEVAQQDSWSHATLGIVCVSTDAAYAHGLLEKVVSFVERACLDLVLLDYETELL